MAYFGVSSSSFKPSDHASNGSGVAFIWEGSVYVHPQSVNSLNSTFISFLFKCDNLKWGNHYTEKVHK